MTLRTILVCLTTQAHASTLMKVAVPLARRHNAHLIGLHTVEALMVYPGIAMHVPEPAFAAFNASQQEQADAIEAVFRHHTQSEMFPSEWRLLQAESTTATDRMVESARAADVVIMSHEDKDADRYDQRNVQVQVIRESGRPAIVVPLDYDGPPVGKNILLGWSDTKEATRAAHDLVPMAAKDAEITILRVTSERRDALTDSTVLDLAETFDRHGLKTRVQYQESSHKEVASTLMQSAFEIGADLIVTGAFGHSRAYDAVIGAVSHTLLRSATVPVLFSK